MKNIFLFFAAIIIANGYAQTDSSYSHSNRQDTSNKSNSEFNRIDSINSHQKDMSLQNNSRMNDTLGRKNGLYKSKSNKNKPKEVQQSKNSIPKATTKPGPFKDSSKMNKENMYLVPDSTIEKNNYKK